MNTSLSESIDPAMLSRIQALRLMDDDFMTVVFSGDNEATEFLLRILLSRDDLKVKSSMTQKEKRNLFGRSVRLDIVAEDTEGKTYNVEVQRADKGASPRRVRYNLAMLDSHTLKKDDDFSALPETYIIFITENDYVGQGKPFYKVKKCFEDTADMGNGDLPFDDGCHIMYVNGEYRGDDAIGHLMHDFGCRNADDMHYDELAERVRFHKQQSKGVETMCRIFEEYGNEVAAERVAKAKAEWNSELVESLLRDGSLSLERIAAIAKVPLEQVWQISQKLAEPVC
ncbi:MAG: PD-(D/E)XK nuclease family transposase [Treponema sp.]|nr:PD-(D/E)XK nuclease family transposase [Treponema sp.]